MKALDEQIGGEHYKNLPMQPIELITLLGMSFIQGNIVKYITRYKSKNKAQDIKKCIHYAKLAIELNDKRRCKDALISFAINKYIRVNNLSLLQRKVITQTAYNHYINVIQYCNELLQKEYPEDV